MNRYGLFVCLLVAVLANAKAQAVNLSVGGAAEDSIDLSGKWQLALDPGNVGIKERWYAKQQLENTIVLPGCLQESGFGDTPGIHTQWWGNMSLEPAFNESPWLKKYEDPGNFKIQSWLLPRKHYIGAAWYAKDIDVGPGWDKKQVSLFLERCHWETQLWVDGRLIGNNRSLGTPHVYLVNGLTPGRHRITIRVDNSQIVDLGKMSHAVSEQTAGTWNGIVGKIFLKKISEVSMRAIQVYPDIKLKKIAVKIKLSYPLLTGSFRWKLAADAKGHNAGNEHNPDPRVVWGNSSSNGEDPVISFDYYLGSGTKLWDEFSPNLYNLELRLTAWQGKKQYTEVRNVVFGMREFKAVGRQFSINGVLTFLRGNTDCALFPDKGYAPTDVPSWKKIWQTYKQFGLNMARFHSWCPPEAAFIAADEEGIYLAPEVGEWATVNTAEQFDFLTTESDNILNAYGNYASFILLGLGNELGGDKSFFKQTVRRWKEKDARHLYTIKANSNSNPDNIDYEVVRGTGKNRSIKMRYQSGWPPAPGGSDFITRPPQTEIDWTNAVLGADYPLIQHETAQICAYPDIAKELPEYKGYLRPTYLEIARDQLTERGMFAQLNDFVRSSGKWQMELIKDEFEAAYRTRGLAGFNWLSLNDFTGQNTAPVGLADAFYRVKSYVDPAQVRRWNGPTVLLARLRKRVFTPSDIFSAVLEVTHFGKAPLVLNDLTAILRSEDGAILKSWKLNSRTVVQGAAQALGTVSMPLRAVKKACKLNLQLASRRQGLVNDWNLWVFPEEKAADFPPGIAVAHVWDSSVLQQLNKGRTVLLLPQIGTLKDQLPGCFTNYYWTSFGIKGGQSSASGILLNPQYPLFKDFPTADHANWQWWDILTQCQPMILDEYGRKTPWPKTYRPIIQPVDSWKINRKLALIAEGRIGKGKLLICSIDIEHMLDSRPAARHFRNCLVEFLSSDAFNPATEISPAMVAGLFGGNSENSPEYINLPADG